MELKTCKQINLLKNITEANALCMNQADKLLSIKAFPLNNSSVNNWKRTRLMLIGFHRNDSNEHHQ